MIPRSLVLPQRLRHVPRGTDQPGGARAAPAVPPRRGADPDGRSLLVAVRDTDERRLNYFKVDIATGNHERVMSTRAFGIPMRRPLVSPDGQAVFYVDREATGVGSSYLRRHDLRTGADTQLKSLTGDNYFNSFAISPDGSQIAYFRSGAETVLEVMPSNGSEPKALYRGGNSGQSRWSGLAWSRDGRQILFVKQPETGGSRQSEPGECRRPMARRRRLASRCRA